jgi:hypothetical protein
MSMKTALCTCQKFCQALPEGKAILVRTWYNHAAQYCSISIYSAATCDRDMFDVFGVSADVDVTCDRGKFSRSSVTSLLM